VLDLEMPEMDGRTFYRQLRERGIAVPVLIVSAYGARAAGRELGTPAMDKPFNPDELVRAVQELLP
jgi:DNA-binding response OmpR family regulator